MKAAAHGDCQACEHLITNCNAININGVFVGHTAMQAACQNGHLDVIRLLLAKGADANMQDSAGDSAVHHAAFGDEPDVIEVCI